MALIEGRLSADDERLVDDHIDLCSDCRALVAEAARSSTVRDRRPESLEPEPELADERHTLLVNGEVLADRFRILRPIGRGAMGVVYQAHDLELGVHVAIKVLTPEASSHPRFIERLRKEIVLGRRVTHENVCRLYDLGAVHGLHFITMEYLEGETLESRIARGPMSMSQAWHITRQVGDALEAAHDHGVIHRDLKPANIMLLPNGEVKVMDFGLAMDLNASQSQTGVAIGTPAYWAPEQARGERATARSDVFAMAVMYCEILWGKRPGWAEDPDLSDVPRVYHSIIRRALKVDPDERYQSIRDVRRDLEQAWARLAPWRPNRRRYLVFAALAGFAAGVAITLALVAALG